ncbi:Ragulator complex protein LAMTOR2 [Neolecta irregularis DAH-3]|uniref:Ragulator complex protein LAMTOR2 n=1 Tax=Neolecta irregularis (strain DAH-3) TaxID=1198029 RepID=A0A1U7LWL5_NEOID|nr:Ragulator complex protein LAMTOR2 [Neolecta irregularis DAH-3]|eukprot:OLL26901.1 Ragulator complex protein LAMTOR2 [Neolecta irregularis DAH-3]
MLKSKPLLALLSQPLSSTIEFACLFTATGSLLSHAPSSSRKGHTYAALASSIWNDYQKLGVSGVLSAALQKDEKAEQLNWVCVDLQNGKIFIQRTVDIPNADEGEGQTESLIVALVGNQDAALGMMKSKVDAISEYLATSIQTKKLEL